MQELSIQEIDMVSGAISTGDVAGWLVSGAAGIAVGGIAAAAFPVTVAVGVGFVSSVAVGAAWSYATAPVEIAPVSGGSGSGGGGLPRYSREITSEEYY